MVYPGKEKSRPATRTGENPAWPASTMASPATVPVLLSTDPTVDGYISSIACATGCVLSDRKVAGKRVAIVCAVILLTCHVCSLRHVKVWAFTWDCGSMDT